MGVWGWIRMKSGQFRETWLIIEDNFNSTSIWSSQIWSSLVNGRRWWTGQMLMGVWGWIWMKSGQICLVQCQFRETWPIIGDVETLPRSYEADGGKMKLIFLTRQRFFHHDFYDRLLAISFKTWLNNWNQFSKDIGNVSWSAAQPPGR